jgi:hypothetical protein
MLKRSITYEDYNGESITEDFYFNISQAELVQLEVEVDGGFGRFIQNIVKSENTKALVGEFKRIILMSYGIKSDDGKRFMKSDALREAFEQSPAYEVLFMEVAMDEKLGTEFIKGILPKSLVQDFVDATKQQLAPAPPTPPSS